MDRLTEQVNNDIIRDVFLAAINPNEEKTGVLKVWINDFVEIFITDPVCTSL